MKSNNKLFKVLQPSYKPEIKHNGYGIDWYEGEGMQSIPAMQADGVNYMYVRGTEPYTKGIANPMLAEVQQECDRLGMMISTYHIWRYNYTGLQQARWAIGSWYILPSFRPAVDVEREIPNTPTFIRELKIMLDALESETGFKPAIYSNIDYVNRYFKYFPSWIVDYPLWLSYPASKPPICPLPWLEIWMWQYSWAEKPFGAVSALDGNLLLGKAL
jgi:GH25 family lysozyme M1 (1,4-beta-N-acetylmuramidase)